MNFETKVVEKNSKAGERLATAWYSEYMMLACVASPAREALSA